MLLMDIGMIIVLLSIILLVISFFIKKFNTKRCLIGILVGVVLFFIGAALSAPNEEETAYDLTEKYENQIEEFFNLISDTKDLITEKNNNNEEFSNEDFDNFIQNLIENANNLNSINEEINDKLNQLSEQNTQLKEKIEFLENIHASLLNTSSNFFEIGTQDNGIELRYYLNEILNITLEKYRNGLS